MQKLKLIFVISLLLLPISLFAKPPVYTEKQTTIVLKPKHSVFIIKLKSNATTGYEWSVDYDMHLLRLLNYTYESPFVPHQKNPKIGAPGYGVWTFEAIPPTTGTLTTVQFSYQRRWEKDPVDHVVFNITLPSSTVSSKSDAR